jgi:hypothetical protein
MSLSDVVVDSGDILRRLEDAAEMITECKEAVATAQKAHGDIDAMYLRQTRCAMCMELWEGSGAMTLPCHNPYTPQYHMDCAQLMHSREWMVSLGNISSGAPVFAKRWINKEYNKARKHFKLTYIEYCLRRGLQFEEQWLYNSAMGYDKDWRADVKYVIEKRMWSPFPNEDEIRDLYDAQKERDEDNDDE